jgi:hypothetical protein
MTATNLTNKQMKKEMIHRLDEQLQSFRSTMMTLDAIDRLEDYDLIDQMDTADKLMAQMDVLLTKMNNIVGN